MGSPIGNVRLDQQLHNNTNEGNFSDIREETQSQLISTSVDLVSSHLEHQDYSGAFSILNLKDISDEIALAVLDFFIDHLKASEKLNKKIIDAYLPINKYVLNQISRDPSNDSHQLRVDEKLNKIARTIFFSQPLDRHFMSFALNFAELISQHSLKDEVLFDMVYEMYKKNPTVALRIVIGISDLWQREHARALIRNENLHFFRPQSSALNRQEVLTALKALILKIPLLDEEIKNSFKPIEAMHPYLKAEAELENNWKV